jgi:hypothetical protein
MPKSDTAPRKKNAAPPFLPMLGKKAPDLPSIGKLPFDCLTVCSFDRWEVRHLGAREGRNLLRPRPQ